VIACFPSGYIGLLLNDSQEEGNSNFKLVKILRCEKRHSFFEFSLCLSRTCLGKMIVAQKWRLYIYNPAVCIPTIFLSADIFIVLSFHHLQYMYPDLNSLCCVCAPRWVGATRRCGCLTVRLLRLFKMLRLVRIQRVRTMPSKTPALCAF